MAKLHARLEQYEAALRRIASMEGTAAFERLPDARGTLYGQPCRFEVRTGVFANDVARAALQSEPGK